MVWDSRFDSINRSIREWSHRTGYETDDHGLIARQVSHRLVCWLILDGPLLELLIGGEIDTWQGSQQVFGKSYGMRTLVGGLPQCCEGDSSV